MKKACCELCSNYDRYQSHYFHFFILKNSDLRPKYKRCKSFKTSVLGLYRGQAMIQIPSISFFPSHLISDIFDQIRVRFPGIR